MFCLVIWGFGAREWTGWGGGFCLGRGRWEAGGIGVRLFFAGEIFDDIAEGDHGVAIFF